MTTDKLETLDFCVRDRVAYIAFDTPERMNSITETRLSDLEQILDAVEGDPSLCALTFTGRGKAFCVGLDLDLLRRAFEDIGYFERVVRRLNEIILRIEALEIPSVASVNGFARAGGFEIALGCDLMLISETAKIGDNHTQVGVMPGAGSTQRLPERIGMQKAKHLIWSANWLVGQEAVDCGLALRAAPADKLEAATEEILNELRSKPAPVLRAVKRAILKGENLPMRERIEAEIETFVAYMGGEPHAREGFWASLGEKAPSN